MPTPLTESNLEAAAHASNGWLWLHLNLADQRCLRWLTQTLGLPQGLAAEFTEQTLRQYLSSRGDYLTGHLNDFRQEFDRNCTEHAWLHLLMAKNFLLTGRVKAVQSAERLRKDLGHGMIFSGPSQLLSHVITNYPDTLDGLHYSLLDELEIIEDHVLDERHRGERKRLMLARREVAQLHRHMRSQRRAVQNAERTVTNFPEGLTPVIARLAHLDQDFEVMEARARFFHDEIDAKLASETNRQLYILSALTAAFLPPTLVAGLFGMNFPGMPWSDTDWGFWLARGMCLFSSAAVWLFLWKASRRRFNFVVRTVLCRYYGNSFNSLQNSSPASATALQAELVDLPEAEKLIELHPAALLHYEMLVTELQAVFHGGVTADTEEAAEKIRSLIARIVIYPVGNGLNIELLGRLTMILGPTDLYPNMRIAASGVNGGSERGN